MLRVCCGERGDAGGEAARAAVPVLGDIAQPCVLTVPRGDVTAACGELCADPGDEVLVISLAAGVNCTETPVGVNVAAVFALAGVQILPGDLGVLRELLGIEAAEAVRPIALMLELVLAKAAPERRGVLLLGAGNAATPVGCTGSKASEAMRAGRAVS